MALHLVTGYAGTAHIKPTDTGSFNAAMFGSGNFVLPRGNRFAATTLTANSVQIKDGDLVMQGRHVRLNSGSTETVTIESGAQGMLRHDLIVCRYSKNSGTGVESASFEVIKGTAVNSTPKDPDFITGDILDGSAGTCDFPLYRVNIDGITISGIDTLFTVYAVSDMTKAVYDSNNAVQAAGGIAGYVDGQVSPVTKRVTTLEGMKYVTAKVFAGDWSGSAPYTNTITVPGMTADWIPGIPTWIPVYKSDGTPDTSTGDPYLEQMTYIKYIVSGNGTLTFIAPDEKPTLDWWFRVPGMVDSGKSS